MDLFGHAMEELDLNEPIINQYAMQHGTNKQGILGEAESKLECASGVDLAECRVKDDLVGLDVEHLGEHSEKPLFCYIAVESSKPNWIADIA
jgi:hypothetical protein